jgi:drug/metabolite transporter (DMT)-like permease
MADPSDKLECDVGKPPTTRPMWWLIGFGIVLLSIPLVSTVAGVLGFISTFESIATSPTQPKPSDLAGGIRFSVILVIGGALLGMIGVVLIVAGMIIRRPVK